MRIAFWSFPDNEEDIRLYSCLANSSSDEFNRGDQLFKTGAVKEPLQIGKIHIMKPSHLQPLQNDNNYLISFVCFLIIHCRFSSIRYGSVSNTKPEF